MQKIKTLFHQSHDVKSNIHSLYPDANLVSDDSDNSEHHLFNGNSKEIEPNDKIIPEKHSESLLIHDSNNSSSSSRRRKTPEEIIKHKFEYQREYLKKWRAKKKKDEESMKTINQLAMNALIKILNANSHLIAEEDMNIINNTIDYNDRCTKIIELINKLYGATS